MEGNIKTAIAIIFLYIIPIAGTLIFSAIIIGIEYLKEKYNKPENKGKIGEKIISLSIGKTIESEKYVLNDLYLKDEDGKTSQIDHIVINKNGIFVIETKNYSGIIYGKEEEQNWTEISRKSRKSYEFYNPVKQNAKHIYMLKKATQTELPIKSIIVFTQGNIKQIESNQVYSIWTMREELKKTQGKEITPEQMQDLYKKIIEAKNNEENREQEHIENIHKMKENIEQGICPRCGGNLIERKGKYGIFYGCSNYPKCKFIKK